MKEKFFRNHTEPITGVQKQDTFFCRCGAIIIAIEMKTGSEKGTKMTQWEIRNLYEIPWDFLKDFDRYQEVKRCWRREEGMWVLRDVPFVEQWNDEDKWEIVSELRQIAQDGGLVLAAFSREECPVGFAAVEREPEGSRDQYAVLHFLYTDRRWRGRGIGKELFRRCCGYARCIGTEKLYISAHSSEESQRFYRRLGCTDAMELIPRLYEREPWDCHIEYALYREENGVSERVPAIPGEGREIKSSK